APVEPGSGADLWAEVTGVPDGEVRCASMPHFVLRSAAPDPAPFVPSAVVLQWHGEEPGARDPGRTRWEPSPALRDGLARHGLKADKGGGQGLTFALPPGAPLEHQPPYRIFLTAHVRVAGAADGSRLTLVDRAGLAPICTCGNPDCPINRAA